MKKPNPASLAFFMVLLLMGCWVITPVGAESKHTGPKEKVDAVSAIHISSDTVKSDQRMKWVEFTGNVRATQEDVVITADRIKIFYKSLLDDASSITNTIEKIIAQGNVKIVFDKKTKKAVAEKAVYIADEKVLRLSGGNPTVWYGKNMIQGKKITVFQAEDRTLVEGAENQQVDAVVYTREKGGVIK